MCIPIRLDSRNISFQIGWNTNVSIQLLKHILRESSQLKMQNEMKLTDESWISYQQGKGNEDTIAQFFSDDESRLDLTKEQKEILEIWDGLDEKEREIFMTFIRSLKK